MRKQYDGGYKDGTYSPVRWRCVLLLLRPRPLANLTGKYEGRGTERTSAGQYDEEFHDGVRNGRDHAEITPRSRRDRDVIAM